MHVAVAMPNIGCVRHLLARGQFRCFVRIDADFDQRDRRRAASRHRAAFPRRLPSACCTDWDTGNSRAPAPPAARENKHPSSRRCSAFVIEDQVQRQLRAGMLGKFGLRPATAMRAVLPVRWRAASSQASISSRRLSLTFLAPACPAPPGVASHPRSECGQCRLARSIQA